MGPVTGTIYITCRKTMNKGMVDRGFAVLKRIAKKWLVVVWLRIDARCGCSNEGFVPYMLDEICRIH